jgi:hypothetical protein
MDGRADTVGELMKRTFCRPYGTDPGVHIIRPSSRDTACRVSTIISYPYGVKRAWIAGFSLMGENCLVEHAANLFARLDQRRERAGCTFYNLSPT